MNFEPITLAQRDTIEQSRMRYGHTVSAWHAFHSLWLWQDVLKLTVLADDGFYAVRYGAKGDHAYFMPCGNPDRIKAFLDSLRETGSFRLYYLREQDKAFLEAYAPGMFQFTYDRDGSEYLYDIAEQCAMSGTKFKKNRQQIHRLQKSSAVEVKPLTAETLPDAAEIEKLWFAQKESDLNDRVRRIADFYAAFRDCGMQGLVIHQNGMPTAFIAGMPVSDTVFDACLLRISGDTPDLGLFACHALMQQISGEYPVLNAEEDMGLPGLRTFKQKMHPCGMADLWEAIYETN